MKAAVTGGTGFLGQALIRLLVGRADAVRVLVRRPEDDARIRSLGAEPVRGDLTIPGGCDGLIAPGAVVFHAAARVDVRGSWDAFRATTVEGTRRLLDHALSHEPARFVYVSSAAVYSPAAGGAALCAERTPARPPAYNYYARAKLEAERLVRTRCERAGCPWTILRLPFCCGPGHLKLATYLSHLAERNHLLVIGRGDNRIATLYVDDAARAVALAGTHPLAAGRIYDVAADEAVTQREFLEAISKALDLPPPVGRVPRRLAYAAAFLADMAARLPGFEPPLSRSIVTLMSTDQVLDTSRIRQELGWRPEVPFAEGMRRMREWHLAEQSCERAAHPNEPCQQTRRRSA